jgi:hypothetical protein
MTSTPTIATVIVVDKHVVVEPEQMLEEPDVHVLGLQHVAQDPAADSAAAQLRPGCAITAAARCA